ncbi:uncharacterized protein ACNLHF_002267 [Anomaloglossus baeobatrachus]
MIKTELEEIKQLVVIQPSHSPWVSLLVLVSKKDGTMRFCVDYRRLNNATKSDAYPMLRIDDLLEWLVSAQFVTILDLSKGYWQIPLMEDAQERSTFITPFGLFEFLKLTTEDDVEAYLTTFERTAEREKWPKEQWADLLAPFLAGEAQKAYFDLEPEAAHDFDKLKAEILARLGVTTAVRAQRVHQWTYQPDKPPRSQMFDLIHLTKKWLQPEVLTAPEMVQRIVLDKYLRALPPSLKRWVSHGNPTTADQLVDLVERYSLAEGLMDDATHPRSSPSRRGSAVAYIELTGPIEKVLIVPTPPKTGDY